MFVFAKKEKKIWDAQYTKKEKRETFGAFMSIWGMTKEQNVICLLKSRKIMLA